MNIASVARALPDHRYSQEEIRVQLERIWADRRPVLSRLPQLHENVLVESRHLALPLEAYAEDRTFGERNDVWIEVAQELGERAVRGALDKVGLAPSDIDTMFTVSITGLASPSLEARLSNRMGLRPDLKRVPIFGLGCVAGVAGLSRAIDYVKAYPDGVAVLLSVELCSLTFQPRDTSVANLISSGLFGDGAAAVVVLGERRAQQLGVSGLEVLDTRSVFYPDTEDLMGWTISERGFDIVLSPAVPSVAQEQLPRDMHAFLADNQLTTDDVATWVCHPGGPKVLTALQAGLQLSDHDVRHSWEVLRTQGNLSSTSALMVLHATLEGEREAAGTRGVCLAMGPGFCSELLLFQWA